MGDIINQSDMFEQNKTYLDFCKNIMDNEEKFSLDYQLIYKIGVLYDLYSIASPNIKDNIKESLDNQLNDITRDSIKRLLETAFIFANLDSKDYVGDLIGDEKESKIEEVDRIRNYSYRIAISVYYYGKYLTEEVEGGRREEDKIFFSNNIIIYRLFTRLGILSKSRNEKIDNVNIFSMDLQGRIESTKKENHNRFCVQDMFEMNTFKNRFGNDFNGFIGDEVFFSDFQNNVLEDLLGYDNYGGTKTGKSLAISAPTSAGKTFILKRYVIYKIIEAFLNESKINIVFIVPSKALINELKQDFIEIFNDYKLSNTNEELNICNIHSHISGQDFKENFENKSNLFIFTQERLNFFYSSLVPSSLKIGLVVVDEAHKVGYGYRGTLLSYIVSKVKTDNIGVQIVLLAPLVSKLLKFKKEFGLDKLEEKFSNFGLVAKNEIFVKKYQASKGGRYSSQFFVNIGDNKQILLFTIKENFGNSQPKYITYLSKKFSVGTQAILFRVNPGKTQEQAENLFIETDGISNPDLEYFSIYINDILPSIDLSKYIKSGIAYHNGILPIAIKSEVERLFKLEKIKYLCANSTVLEGVNLPAKNIFIGNDGGSDYINNSDFKNLIGRAGRLNHHLSGNIFYIDFSCYEDKLPDEKNTTEEFTNNISNVIDDSKSTEIQGITKFDRFLDYLKNDDGCFKAIIYTNPEEKRFLSTELKDFEYMTGYLLAKYREDKSKFTSTVGSFIYKKGEEKVEKLQKLEGYINTIYQDIILYTGNSSDDELMKIITKNIFIDPRKQLRFYVNVLGGKNEFILENIMIFSDILKVFNNTEVLDTELKQYGDTEFERKITEKSRNLESLFGDVQSNFVRKYQLHSLKYDKVFDEYFQGNNISNDPIVLNIFNSWICSYGLKDILRSNFNEKLRIINNELQFNYLNAFSIYFELANLGYKRYLEQHDTDLYNLYLSEGNIPQLDTNFIYYMELGTFYPNLLYLISKGVSRESAIWLKDNKIINLFPYENIEEKEYFEINKEKILNDLKERNRIVIRNELLKFIY